MHRRCVEIGADGHDARPPVPRLGEEVEVRNLGVRRIPAPDQDEVGPEVVVRRPAGDGHPQRHRRPLLLVPHLGVQVEYRRAHQMREALHGEPGGHARGVPLEHHRLRSVPRDDFDQAAGDVRKGLLPAHPLPPPFAAFPSAPQRMRHPRGMGHVQGVTRALLASPRVEVGHGVVRRRIIPRRLLEHHDAVLHEDVVRAAPLVPAVQEVRAPHHPVPSPPGAVGVAGSSGASPALSGAPVRVGYRSHAPLLSLYRHAPASTAPRPGAAAGPGRVSPIV